MSASAIVAVGLVSALITGGIAALLLGDDAVERWMLGGFAFLLVGALAIGIPLAIRSQHAWENWCKEQGGHVDSHTSTSTVTTIGAKGQPGVGVSSDTTYYCLSADGRVLDVE